MKNWQIDQAFLGPTGNELSFTPSTANGGTTFTTPTVLFKSDGNVGIGTTTPQGAFVVTNGNVGIGTWSPTGNSDSTMLHITGNAGQLHLTSTASGATATDGTIITHYSDNNLYINNQEATKMFFYDNGGARMTIDSAGNVGIGTTVPGNNHFISRVNTGGTDPPESLGAFVLGNDSTYTNGILRVKNAGNRGNIGNGSGSALVNFEFSDTTAFIIDKSGNVGIGTMVPGTALQVKADSGITIARSSVLSTLPTYANDDLTHFAFSAPTTSIDTQANERVLDIVSGASNTGSSIRFMTGAANAAATAMMVIRPTGNVGIGTTLPTAKLETQSSTSAPASGNVNWDTPTGAALAVTYNGVTTDSGSAIVFKAQQSGASSTLFGYSAIKGAVEGTNAGYLSFLTRNASVYATERMRIDSNGNVGIGSAAPGVILDIKPGGVIRTGNRIDIMDGSAGGKTASIGADNDIGLTGLSGLDFTILTPGQFAVGTNGSTSTRFMVSTSGNVGIGTTGPGNLLEVKNSGATTAGVRINNGTGNWQLGVGITVASDGKFGIYDVGNTTNRLVIDTSGNMGIGSTAPGQVLDVQGNIRASGAHRGPVGITGSLSVANGAVGNLYASSGASGPNTGLLIVSDIAYANRTALYLHGSYGGVVLISGNGLFTATKDNGGTVNIYYESGNIKYQNNSGVDPLVIGYTLVSPAL